MRKMLPFLLVGLLQAGPAIAQPLGDHQFQFQFDNFLSEWVQGPDGAWFGVGWSRQYPGFPQASPFVIKWNPLNNQLYWKTDVPALFTEVAHAVAVLPALDGGVYVGIVADACDYPTPEVLARLDGHGDVLWTVATPDEARFNTRVWLLPAANGHVVFQTEAQQFVFDSNGTSISTAPVGFGWNGFVANSQGGYLAYGNQALGSFSPFFSVPFPANVRHAAQMPSGDWLLLGTNKLYRANAAFDVLAEKTLPHLKPWSKVFWADDVCWITGENNAGASVLQRLNPLTLDAQIAYTYDKQYRVLSVLHHPGDTVLWLSGDCNFERNQTVFLKAVPKDNPMIAPAKSVSLTNIRLDKTPVYHPPFICSPFTGYRSPIQFGPIFVTVKNTGTESVSTFWVNGRFNSCWFICYGEDQYSTQFYYPLNPGESAELLMYGDLVLDGPPNAATFTLCFWTALPDDALDALPEDDRHCQTVSVIVSAEEPTATAGTVRAAPNPAYDQVVFSLDGAEVSDTPYQMVLTDAAGRVVRQTTETGPTWTLERGTLPAGLYLYQIAARHGVVGTGKIAFVR